VCAEAVEVALSAADEAFGPDAVGEHLGVVAEGDRVVTHLFDCKEPAYRGWHWAVTLTRASRAKFVTLDETVLLPGADSVLAPEWVPWSERLRPGDMGPGDLLPTEAEDLRLEPGWLGDSEYPVGEPLSELLDVDEMEALPAPPPEAGSIGAVAQEIGMGRPRVLSRYGLHAAADRWEEKYGPKTAMAQAAPANCMTCGFLVPMAGSLRQAFGVCANEFSPAEGRVVSLDYGCGGHSEAAVMPKPLRPAEPVLDETAVEALPLHPDRHSSVEESAPAEELGHS
jgi:hypothetical protein